jgi:hypothetical protein
MTNVSKQFDTCFVRRGLGSFKYSVFNIMDRRPISTDPGDCPAHFYRFSPPNDVIIVISSTFNVFNLYNSISHQLNY